MPPCFSLGLEKVLPKLRVAPMGVPLGIVSGIQQTYSQSYHEAVPLLFTPQLTVPTFLGRVLVGIPTILFVKFCSKALAKRILPVISNMLDIPIRSTGYIPVLKEPVPLQKDDDIKQNPRYLQKLFFHSNQQWFDVDTGIRFLQYGGLAW